MLKNSFSSQSDSAWTPVESDAFTVSAPASDFFNTLLALLLTTPTTPRLGATYSRAVQHALDSNQLFAHHTLEGAQIRSVRHPVRGVASWEDGDEVVLRAHGKRAAYVSIGFGERRATILPA